MTTEIKCYELMDSMSGSITNESEGGEIREVKRRYVVGRCTGGFNEAVDEVSKYAPPYVDSDGAGLYWVRKRLEVSGIGNAYFDCTATYQTLQPKPPQDPNNPQNDFTPGSIAWDTTGNTEHITQGLDDENRYDEDAPDFYSALNVSGDSVQGLDVVRPTLKYSETWIIPAQVAINCDFVGSVYRLTGTVNQNVFRCFQPGEALFLGGRAQWTGDQPYVAVTFDWEARPNVTDFYVKGVAMIAKEGWEHVSIHYAPETNSGSLIRQPIAAYKNRVYHKNSWAALGMIAGTIGAPRAGATGVQPQAGGNGNT
jgi:hypothetical protein